MWNQAKTAARRTTFAFSRKWYDIAPSYAKLARVKIPYQISRNTDEKTIETNKVAILLRINH